MMKDKHTPQHARLSAMPPYKVHNKIGFYHPLLAFIATAAQPLRLSTWTRAIHFNFDMNVIN